MGMGRKVRTLFVESRAELNAAGVPVDKEIEAIDVAQGEAEKANAEQEDAKRRAQESTEKSVAKTLRLSHVVSNALDMAIAAVGKETLAGKNFRKLRSAIDRDPRPTDVVATPGGKPPQSPG